MDKLQTALQRLFGALPAAAPGESPALLDNAGHTRTLVLSLARPADWRLLGRVWQGVQQEGGLPAPAIAVSGQGALQLWFTLAQAVPLAQGQAFLAALQRRYLADVVEVAPTRLQHWPPPEAVANDAVDGAADGMAHTLPWPGQAVAEDRWSAFIAPDLAPVFEAEPWLDVQPGVDGQAELLARLQPMPAADFQRVLAAWGAEPEAATATAPLAQPIQPAQTASGATTPTTDPRQFLLSVMNDASVPLALRIEAAKGLLSTPR
jgi:hypothetical protein